MTDDQSAQQPANPVSTAPATPDASTQQTATPALDPAQAQTAPAAAQPAVAPAQAQRPPPPVPQPVQQPIVSPIAAPVPPQPSAASESKEEAPYVPATTEDHKGGLLVHLQNELKLCRIRRENLRTTELLIKEDGFIRHLEGIIGILRQYSFR
jgi:hypothetical protein